MKKALLVLSVLLIILSTATAGTVSGNTFRIKSHVGRITIEQANEEAKLFTIKVATGDTESTSDEIFDNDAFMFELTGTTTKLMLQFFSFNF